MIQSEKHRIVIHEEEYQMNRITALLLTGVLSASMIGCGSTADHPTSSASTISSASSVSSEEAVSFEAGSVVRLNVGEETENDALPVVSGNADESYDFCDINVTFHGETGTLPEIYAYDTDAWLITAADGRQYVYTVTHQDNDWQTLFAWDLNGGTPEVVGSVDGGIDSDTEFNDPSAFTIIARSYLFSTVGISKTYHVGENGVPEAESEWYAVEAGDLQLTAKTDLSAQEVEDSPLSEVPESGIETTVPKGTVLSFYRSDDSSRTDFKAEDGTIYRLTVDDPDAYPETIGGIELDDALDGMVYAG